MLLENHGSPVPLDQVLSKLDVGYFQYRLLFVCGIGFAAAAIEIVLTAFLFLELRSVWKLNELQLGILPSIVGFGSVCGEIFWGQMADNYGRRSVFTITVYIVVFFGTLSAFAPNAASLYILRACVGFGYGGNIAVDFAVYSEFLPTHSRGRMMFYMTAFWPLGQIATCLFAWAIIPAYGWRAFLIACVIPSLLAAALRPMIPESPRWLLLHGRNEEAVVVCKEIAALNGKTLEEVGLVEGVTLVLENEGSALSRSSEEVGGSSTDVGGKRSARPLDLFKPGLRGTTIGLLMLVGGLGSVTYGSTTLMPTLLQMKGVDQLGIYEAMLTSALAQIPGIFLAIWITTTFGRLRPLQASLIPACLALMGFAFSTKLSTVITCLCLTSCWIEFAWALHNVYTPEVFPTELRATAIGSVSAFGSLMQMATPMASALLLQADRVTGVVVFYSIICALVTLSSLFLLTVETMDRDLQDKCES